MHFLKSLKGEHSKTTGGSSSRPTKDTEVDSTTEKKSSQDPRHDYEPLVGAPPQCAAPQAAPLERKAYAASPGLPPGRDEYNPRPKSPERSECAPPHRSPPAPKQPDTDPPPYHDWTSVPDTALLPPPPALGNDISPFSNANRTDADRAHDWCNSHPLVNPHQPTLAQITSVKHGDVGLLKPRRYTSDLYMVNTGAWKGSSRAKSKDASLISSTPLYFTFSDSPSKTGITKTIYFEVKVQSLGRGRSTDESSLAIGYCAMPYPNWRMPGWERGSVAVHGDDGRRYVNDTWGGKEFTSSFRVGDTVGLGMTFSTPESPPEYSTSRLPKQSLKVEVIFTRNGIKEGSWDLHEELDSDNDLGVHGLEGQHDLYGILGTFGGTEFDVFFNSQDWLWQPR